MEDERKIAIPTFGTRVSPRFDCAQAVLVVTIDVEAEGIGSNLDPVLLGYDWWGRPLLSNDNRGSSVDARLVLPLPSVYVTCPYPSAYVMVMGTRQRLLSDPTAPDALWMPLTSATSIMTLAALPRRSGRLSVAQGSTSLTRTGRY